MTLDALPQVGQKARMPAGLARITRIEYHPEGCRIFFRYIRNGKESATERNVWRTREEMAQ